MLTDAKKRSSLGSVLDRLRQERMEARQEEEEVAARVGWKRDFLQRILANTSRRDLLLALRQSAPALLQRTGDDVDDDLVQW